MGEEPTLSYGELRVLRPFLKDPSAAISVVEAIRASGLASGTAYPLLLRIECVGYLQSRWESGNPRELGHPRRRFYRITPRGLTALREAHHQFDQVKSTLAPSE